MKYLKNITNSNLKIRSLYSDRLRKYDNNKK